MTGSRGKGTTNLAKAPKRMIVAITGASGVIYGVRALQLLHRTQAFETHLVLSPSAVRTLIEETAHTPDEIRALASVVHSHKDIGASIASGSFKTEGMLVAPCSVKTLSGIANCYADDLIARAADVCLKERRRLVLLFRETPLHAGHIALLAQATQSGAVVMPPVPGFYSRAADGRRYHQPDGGARPRSVRHRCRGGRALDRGGRARARGAQQGVYLAGLAYDGGMKRRTVAVTRRRQTFISDPTRLRPPALAW